MQRRGCHAEGQAGDTSISSRRTALQQRFHEVATEVEERGQFIASMQQAGGLQASHVGIVKSQVAAKVQEMEQLDDQIRELDRQLQSNSSA